ncbi:protein tag-52-related [Anaeramoeba flamelloides]|uniref:Protein tag-52-related n=1 Tax=Anaeramoeba flamelloides TaxID=1746091 RepID=A0AAV7ZZH2_9EUKA|nr:protein tag-52-related [Anaeramoeba flamelloides]
MNIKDPKERRKLRRKNKSLNEAKFYSTLKDIQLRSSDKHFETINPILKINKDKKKCINTDQTKSLHKKKNSTGVSTLFRSRGTNTLQRNRTLRDLNSNYRLSPPSPSKQTEKLNSSKYKNLRSLEPLTIKNLTQSPRSPHSPLSPSIAQFQDFTKNTTLEKIENEIDKIDKLNNNLVKISKLKTLLKSLSRFIDLMHSHFERQKRTSKVNQEELSLLETTIDEFDLEKKELQSKIHQILEERSDLVGMIESSTETVNNKTKELMKKEQHTLKLEKKIFDDAALINKLKVKVHKLNKKIKGYNKTLHINNNFHSIINNKIKDKTDPQILKVQLTQLLKDIYSAQNPDSKITKIIISNEKSSLVDQVRNFIMLQQKKITKIKKQKKKKMRQFKSKSKELQNQNKELTKQLIINNKKISQFNELGLECKLKSPEHLIQDDDPKNEKISCDQNTGNVIQSEIAKGNLDNKQISKSLQSLKSNISTNNIIINRDRSLTLGAKKAEQISGSSKSQIITNKKFEQFIHLKEQMENDGFDLNDFDLASNKKNKKSKKKGKKKGKGKGKGKGKKKKKFFFKNKKYVEKKKVFKIEEVKEEEEEDKEDRIDQEDKKEKECGNENKEEKQSEEKEKNVISDESVTVKEEKVKKSEDLKQNQGSKKKEVFGNQGISKKIENKSENTKETNINNQSLEKDKFETKKDKKLNKFIEIFEKKNNEDELKKGGEKYEQNKKIHVQEKQNQLKMLVKLFENKQITEENQNKDTQKKKRPTLPPRSFRNKIKNCHLSEMGNIGDNETKTDQTKNKNETENMDNDKKKKKSKASIITEKQAATNIQALFRGFQKRKKIKKLKQRIKISIEILKTEREYISRIRTLIEIYLIPIIDQGYIEGGDVKHLKNELEMIFGLSKKLLVSLESNVPKVNYTQTDEIGKTFKNLSPAMIVYTAYINRYSSLFTLTKEARAKNTTFDNFLIQTKLQLKSKLGLFDLLIAPIQRVPRYLLLLKELLKYSEKDHPDYKNLESAHESISKQANILNESRREFAKIQKVFKISQKLRNYKNFNLLDTPSRGFIKKKKLKNVVDKKIKNRIGILFTDLLLIITEKKKRGKFQKKYETKSYNLEKIFCINQATQLIRTDQNEDLFFLLSDAQNNQDDLILMATSIQNRDRWVKDIELVIEKNAQNQFLPNSNSSGNINSLLPNNENAKNSDKLNNFSEKKQPKEDLKLKCKPSGRIKWNIGRKKSVYNLEKK